jgi:hypothetical protein
LTTSMSTCLNPIKEKAGIESGLDSQISCRFYVSWIWHYSNKKMGSSLLEIGHIYTTTEHTCSRFTYQHLTIVCLSPSKFLCFLFSYLLCVVTSAVASVHGDCLLCVPISVPTIQGSWWFNINVMLDHY